MCVSIRNHTETCVDLLELRKTSGQRKEINRGEREKRRERERER